jgi:hypothetical protein
MRYFTPARPLNDGFLGQKAILGDVCLARYSRVAKQNN